MDPKGTTFKVLRRTKQSPAFLSAVLAERYNPKDPMPAMKYPWCKNRNGVRVDYPDHLVLVTHDEDWPRLTFDYHPDFNGFLISDRLRAFLVEHGCDSDYQLVPLKCVNINGKSNTDKTYFYLRFVKRVNLVDYDKSDYVLGRGAKEEEVGSTGFGAVGYENLVIKSLEKVKPFFNPRDSLFVKTLVVTDRFAARFEEQKFIGVTTCTLSAHAQDFRQRHDFNHIDPEKVKKT